MTEKEKEYRTERLLKITAECNEMTSECLRQTSGETVSCMDAQWCGSDEKTDSQR